MKTVYQGVYFGLTALLLCPAISLAAEVDYGGHLKYFFSYSDFPDKSVFSGDDNHYIEHLGDLQALVIPRRDVTSGDLESQSSSAAAKMHWLKDQDEVDLLAARN